MSDHLNYYGTLRDALVRWDQGSTVWTVEMGGLGPGYEQCIQIGAFELCKAMIDAPMPEDDEEKQKLFDAKLHELCKTIPVLDGITGEQAGAMISVAYKFIKFGYNEMMNKADSGRRIMVSKNFPAMA